MAFCNEVIGPTLTRGKGARHRQLALYGRLLELRSGFDLQQPLDAAGHLDQKVGDRITDPQPRALVRSPIWWPIQQLNLHSAGRLPPGIPNG